ncbi:MAG: hypothetical protein MJ081_00955 [Ruminococcus sp.]|nr:hypothetical protein [Ruminococcus sp.]
MKNIMSNIWTKRAFALISLLYALGVCRLAYLAIFYDIHIKSASLLCVVLSAVSVIALIAMFYSRKQIITRISSVVILFAMLPVALLYFGQWCIIIPIVLTGIIIFLGSGAGEGAKTVWGTIILLTYVFGSIAFFMFKAFFVSDAQEFLIDSGTSPSGQYRYEVVNVDDSSNGSTTVYVEPNYADVKYPFTRFSLKNIRRAVYVSRPEIEGDVKVDWETQQRTDITKFLNHLSENIEIELSEEQLEMLGYEYDRMLVLTFTDMDAKDKFAIGYTAHDVDPVPLDSLTANQLAYFGIEKTPNGRYFLVDPSEEIMEDLEGYTDGPVYFNYLTSRQRKSLNISKSRSVFLTDLSDEQLDKLGVADSGDVMKFNGKTCFRYYVSDLDGYFNVDERKLSLDLIK